MTGERTDGKGFPSRSVFLILGAPEAHQEDELLVVRNDQMAVFANVLRRAFEDRLARDLGARFPGSTGALGEASLRALVADGVTRAAGYGIRGEPEVTAFVEIMLAAGGPFDDGEDGAWAREVLADGGASAAIRLQVVRARAGRPAAP